MFAISAPYNICFDFFRETTAFNRLMSSQVGRHFQAFRPCTGFYWECKKNRARAVFQVKKKIITTAINYLLIWLSVKFPLNDFIYNNKCLPHVHLIIICFNSVAYYFERFIEGNMMKTWFIIIRSIELHCRHKLHTNELLANEFCTARTDIGHTKEEKSSKWWMFSMLLSRFLLLESWAH